MKLNLKKEVMGILKKGTCPLLWTIRIFEAIKDIAKEYNEKEEKIFEYFEDCGILLPYQMNLNSLETDIKKLKIIRSELYRKTVAFVEMQAALYNQEIYLGCCDELKEAVHFNVDKTYRTKLKPLNDEFKQGIIITNPLMILNGETVYLTNNYVGLLNTARTKGYPVILAAASIQYVSFSNYHFNGSLPQGFPVHLETFSGFVTENDDYFIKEEEYGNVNHFLYSLGIRSCYA